MNIHMTNIHLVRGPVLILVRGPVLILVTISIQDPLPNVLILLTISIQDPLPNECTLLSTTTVNFIAMNITNTHE